MAKGDVDIKMDFEFGNATGARMKVNELYRTMSGGMKQVQRDANNMHNSLLRAGRTLMGGLVAGGVGGAVSMAFREINQEAGKLAAKHGDLEKAITPLSSLGDNVGNLVAIRREVAQLAGAADAGTDAIGRFLFDLQSSTGNLSKALRNELKIATLDLSEATGGDLVTAQNLLTKSYQIFGHEVANVIELQNKLMHAQDQGSFSFEDLAARLPELASAGQVVGLSLNEVLAAMIGASQKSGSIEKTFTGLRNVFLTMAEAQEKGVELTGSFIDKLERLNEEFESSPRAMQKLFGKEAVVHAQNMATSVDVIRDNLEKISGISGDESAAEELIRKRLTDPVAAKVRVDALNARLRSEAPNLAEETAPQTALARWKRRGDLGALGVQIATGATEDSWAATFGRWRAQLGDDNLIRKGRLAEIENTAPGPLRDLLLRQNFNAERLNREAPLYSSPWDPVPAPPVFDLGAERTRFPFQGPEAIHELRATGEKTNTLLEETNRLLRAQGARGPMPMPSGSRANATEAL